MIRKMTEGDILRVAELEKEIFSDPWSENVYRQTLALDGVVYLVVEEDGLVVGAAGVRNIVGDGEITNVMIAPEYRRSGYALELLEKLMDEGRRLGITDFTLEVRKSNIPAISLYEKLGFTMEGERPGFYERPKENALIMWKREKDIR